MAENLQISVGIGLPRVVGGQVQRSRFLSEQPGLQEARRKCRIVCTVGLETEGQVLGVAKRHGPPRMLVEHPSGREVVEGYAGGGDEGASSPSSGKLQLAGRLLGDVVHQVHGVVVLVRNHRVSVRAHDGLGIELPERSYFAYGTFEVRLAEEVARAGENLPAHHLFAGEVVAVDDNVVQSGLLALGDAHLDIDGVILDIGLDGGDVEEEIAVVAVHLRNVVLVLLAAAPEALFHGHYVVDVAGLYGEHLVQLVGMIDGVARPGNVAEVVFVSFLHSDVYAQAAGFYGVDGILDNAGVTVSGFVESADESLLVVGILLGVEFLGMEEVVELAGLGLLHAAGEFVILEMLVADEVDVLHLDLDSPVDGEVHADSLLDYGILHHLGLDLAVQEALFSKILLDDVGGCLLDVIRELPAAAQVQTLLKIFLLAGLHSRKRPPGHPRALDDDYVEESGVAVCAQVVDFHRHILEIALKPEAPDDAGQLVARNGDFHSLLQTGELYDLVFAEVVVSLDADAADLVFDGTVIIDFYSPLLGERHEC